MARALREAKATPAIYATTVPLFATLHVDFLSLVYVPTEYSIRTGFLDPSRRGSIGPGGRSLAWG